MTQRPLEAALRYAGRGWRVLPVAPGAKEPIVAGGHKAATLDATQIRAWWRRNPKANIGIATGPESNLTVLDPDARDGKPGVINLTRLCAAHGGLPATLRARTGSGGLHLYFKFTNRLRAGANVLAEAVDVKGEGGYVVAPPSLNDKGQYLWENESAPVLELPEWLVPEQRPVAPPRARAHRKYTLAQVEAMLGHVDPDDRDRWLQLGIILGREFAQRLEAWELYERWSARSAKFEQDRADNRARMHEMFYERSKAKPRSGGAELTLGTLIHWATEGGWKPAEGGTADYDNFYLVHPAGKALYVPSGALWPLTSVDAALPPRLIGHSEKGEPQFELPSKWLARHRGVESMVFDPALPQIVADKVARLQGIVEQVGARLFNNYCPPRIQLGDPRAAQPFVEHLERLFPNEKERAHIVAWLAHRVQKPGEKVRHALLIGGPPGVGKDTIIEAVMPAVGEWNCASIAPDQVLSQFNEFKASILLRINEVADLHDVNRYKFYEATKNLISGTPDWTEVNPKYGTKFHVRNVAGVVLTTNYIDTGIYLPPDDRRHYAVQATEQPGTPEQRDEYFRQLWNWLLNGGFAHVAAYLHSVPLGAFDPNAPPPKTETFMRIVANAKGSDAWLIDALDELGAPRMVRADTLRECIKSDDLKPNEISARLSAAMSRQGYEVLREATRADGRHEFKDQDGKLRRVMVYVARALPGAERPAILATLKGPSF